MFPLCCARNTLDHRRGAEVSRHQSCAREFDLHERPPQMTGWPSNHPLNTLERSLILVTLADEDLVGGSRQVRADFTGCEMQLEVFRRLINAPEGDALPSLAIHGVGGCGKTTLIGKLADELDRLDPPMPYARFNFENRKSPATAAREVLLRLRSNLEDRIGLTFPRFDLLICLLLAAQGGRAPSLVALNPSLKNALDVMMDLVGISSSATGVFVQSHMLESKAIKQLLAKAAASEDVLDLLQGVHRDPTLPEQLVDRFAVDLLQGLPPRSGKACRGALFFNTVETLWMESDVERAVSVRAPDEWLRRLVQRLRRGGVLVVVAGRNKLPWAEEDAEWNNASETLALCGFSRHDGRIYLAKGNVGPMPPASESPLQTAILDACAENRATDGQRTYLPFYLALCANIVDNNRDKNGGADPAPSTFIGLPGERTAQALAQRFLPRSPTRNGRCGCTSLVSLRCSTSAQPSRSTGTTITI